MRRTESSSSSSSIESDASVEFDEDQKSCKSRRASRKASRRVSEASEADSLPESIDIDAAVANFEALVESAKAAVSAAPYSAVSVPSRSRAPPLLVSLTSDPPQFSPDGPGANRALSNPTLLSPMGNLRRGSTGPADSHTAAAAAVTAAHLQRSTDYTSPIGKKPSLGSPGGLNSPIGAKSPHTGIMAARKAGGPGSLTPPLGSPGALPPLSPKLAPNNSDCGIEYERSSAPVMRSPGANGNLIRSSQPGAQFTTARASPGSGLSPTIQSKNKLSQPQPKPGALQSRKSDTQINAAVRKGPVTERDATPPKMRALGGLVGSDGSSALLRGTGENISPPRPSPTHRKSECGGVYTGVVSAAQALTRSTTPPRSRNKGTAGLLPQLEAQLCDAGTMLVGSYAAETLSLAPNGPRYQQLTKSESMRASTPGREQRGMYVQWSFRGGRNPRPSNPGLEGEMSQTSVAGPA